MGTLDSAFADAAAQIVTQLSEQVGLVFTRPRAGTFDVSSGTETGGSAIAASSAVSAVRGRAYEKPVFGAASSAVKIRVKEFSLLKSDLVTAWPGAVSTGPMLDDVVTGGDSIARRITEIHSEVNDTMWRIVTESGGSR